MSDKAPPHPEPILLVDDKTWTTKYRPVSADEKRAQMAAAGEEEPEGEQWQQDGRRPAGGRWRNTAKQQAYDAKFRADPVRTAKKKAYADEYNADPVNKARAKAIRVEYNADPVNKAKRKAANAEYSADPVNKAKRKARDAKNKYAHPIMIAINERKEAEQCKDGIICDGGWLSARFLQSDHLPEHEKRFIIGGLNFKSDGTARTLTTDPLASTVVTLEDVMEEMDRCETACALDHKNRTDQRNGRADYKTDEELRREEIERNR